MNIKTWFIPALFLTLLFSENLVYAYYSVINSFVESSALQKVFIPLALVSYLLLLYDFSKGYVKKGGGKVIMIMLLIIMMYGMTSLLYQNMPSGYLSHLLRYGSICVASGIMGIHLAHKHNTQKVDFLLPLFVLFVGVIIGTYGMRAAQVGEMVSRDDDVGMSYQRVSYLMAEVFSFCAYFVFFSSIKNTLYYKIMKWPMLGMMLFSAILCPMSGGRGASLLLLISMAFLFFMEFHSKRVNKVKALIAITLIVVGLLYLSQIFNVNDSAGFIRISEKLTEDSGREQLYNKAYESINNHLYLGAGVGSIWTEVGFYSHNIFIDLLVEVGVWGLLLMIIAVYAMFKKLLNISKNDSLNIFFLILLLQSIVHLMFSAYWISYFPFWLVLGYSFSINFRNNRIVDVR